MKRILFIVCVFIFLFLVSGCGDKKDKGKSDSPIRIEQEGIDKNMEVEWK